MHARADHRQQVHCWPQKEQVLQRQVRVRVQQVQKMSMQALQKLKQPLVLKPLAQEQPQQLHFQRLTPTPPSLRSLCRPISL